MAIDENKLIALLERIDERLDRVEERLGPDVERAPGYTPEPEPQAEWVPDDSEPVLPDPPDDVKVAWAALCDAGLFENWAPSIEKGQTLDKESMVDAFKAGGPLWLAAYAHDFLMGLPGNWRAAMVEQVVSYAPIAGSQLGRDILRHDTESAAGWAYERGLEQADKRLKGLVEGRNTG